MVMANLFIILAFGSLLSLIFKSDYGLKSGSHILDIDRANGVYMRYNFLQTILDVRRVAWIDVSQYTIDNAMPAVRSFLKVADVRDLSNSDYFLISLLTLCTIWKDKTWKSL